MIRYVKFRTHELSNFVGGWLHFVVSGWNSHRLACPRASPLTSFTLYERVKIFAIEENFL